MIEMMIEMKKRRPGSVEPEPPHEHDKQNRRKRAKMDRRVFERGAGCLHGTCAKRWEWLLKKRKAA